MIIRLILLWVVVAACHSCYVLTTESNNASLLELVLDLLFACFFCAPATIFVGFWVFIIVLECINETVAHWVHKHPNWFDDYGITIDEAKYRQCKWNFYRSNV